MFSGIGLNYQFVSVQLNGSWERVPGHVSVRLSGQLNRFTGAASFVLPRDSGELAVDVD